MAAPVGLPCVTAPRSPTSTVRTSESTCGACTPGLPASDDTMVPTPLPLKSWQAAQLASYTCLPRTICPLPAASGAGLARPEPGKSFR